jgi:MoaA/NifB/PqqE/SkfB family radical SAM enzyme
LPQREEFLKPLFKKELNLVILFVTSICNARCRTCFYWLELNRKGDMSFSELSKLSSTMPDFEDLWLSGGEPFLRRDLAEIVTLFHKNNKVRGVRIPTNGLPTDQSVKTVRAILEQCPGLKVEIDLSIDGFRKTHDRIRAVPGNFDKALETMKELEVLREAWPNLTVYVNSVITSENRTEIVPLGRYFLETRDLDGHYFQIIRGDPKDQTLQEVKPEELKETYRNVLPLNFQYISKPTRNRGWLDGLRSGFWRAGYEFTYETQLRNYTYRTKWKMPCTAGRTSLVIDYNGDVRVCELRKPIGNLRNYEMNFQAFWRSAERKREVQQVKLDQCFCTHVCFMYDSMRHSKRVMLWELPRLVVKYATTTLLKGRSERSNPPLRLETTAITTSA